jgi:hypothetical protein
MHKTLLNKLVNNFNLAFKPNEAIVAISALCFDRKGFQLTGYMGDFKVDVNTGV